MTRVNSETHSFSNFFGRGYFTGIFLLILTQTQILTLSNPKPNPKPAVTLKNKQMKKARMNISHFRFILYNLKFFSEIATLVIPFFHFSSTAKIAITNIGTKYRRTEESFSLKKSFLENLLIKQCHCTT